MQLRPTVLHAKREVCKSNMCQAENQSNTSNVFGSRAAYLCREPGSRYVPQDSLAGAAGNYFLLTRQSLGSTRCLGKSLTVV